MVAGSSRADKTAPRALDGVGGGLPGRRPSGHNGPIPTPSLSMTATVLILNGPNLNLLGKREPHIYGGETLADVEAQCRSLASEVGLSIDFKQSNAEHHLIDWIHEARETAAGVIINPAAFTHTSIAILDALNACEFPILEVHVSNVHRREDFRHHSYISLAATGVIAGFGIHGYLLALRHMAYLLARKGQAG
jgi:3-dehydroquinate dehydratase-2